MRWRRCGGADAVAPMRWRRCGGAGTRWCGANGRRLRRWPATVAFLSAARQQARMMIALAPLAFTLVAAPGLPYKDVHDLVAQTDAVMADGKKVTALLAGEADLQKVARAMGVAEADVGRMVKAMLAEQRPPAPPKMTVTRALVEQRGDTVTIELGGPGKEAVRVDWALLTDAGKTRALLLATPMLEEKTFDEIVAKRASITTGKRSLWKKSGGTWSEEKMPEPPPPTCEETLKAAAKNVYIAEESYRAELDKYDTDLAKIGVAPTKGVTVVVKSASMDKFVAEVALGAAKGQIDQTNTFTLLAPCPAK
jgi:hypothetical protein